MVSLKQLDQFVAVAEELHFGRAAQRLNMAQPPLSMAIRKLEDALGVALFDRSSRRVGLTQAGRTLLEESYRVSHCVDMALERTRQAHAGHAGHLDLGFLSTSSVLPDLVRRYRASHPDVELRLTEATTAEQLALLAQGRIDIGVMRPPGKPPKGIAFETVARQRLMLALPENHPRASRASMDLAAFVEEPFVITPPDSANGLNHVAAKLCREAGFEPRVVQVAREIPSLMALVAAGVGVAIVPESHFVTGYQGVVVRPIERGPAGSEPTIDMLVAWSVARRTPIVDGFLKSVRGRARL